MSTIRMEAGEFDEMRQKLHAARAAIKDAKSVIAAAIVVLQFDGKDKSAQYLRDVLDKFVELTP